MKVRRDRPFAGVTTLCGVAAIGLSSAAHPAFAQDATSASGSPSAPSATEKQNVLEVVTVTAEKRTEDLQNVPISITAVSADKLQAAGVTNLQQLDTLVPGVSVSNIGGGVSFFVRGVGTVSSQVENNVLTYVDDVLIPNQRSVGLDLIDEQQVAVLKGPQGTLFGRNATGGVIQITTREPSDHLEVDLRTGSDNYGTWRTDVLASGPITKDLGVSVMGSYTTQAEGWGHNEIAGNDTFKIDGRVYLRGKLVYKPTDAISLKITGDYEYNRGTTDINEVPYPGTVLAFEPTVVGPDGYYNTRTDLPNTTRLQSQGVSGDLGINLGFADFRSITSYRTGAHDWQFDADRTPTPAFNIFDYEEFSDVTQEVQLLSPSNQAFKWVIGGYYFNNTNANDPIVFDFMGPFAPGPNPLVHEAVFGSEEATSYAGFAQATVEVFPGTNLTGGVRYTTETRSLTGTDSGTFKSGAVVLFTTADSSVSSNNTSFRAAIDHKFADNIMGYVSYDRGFRSGGYNISSLTNPPYAPEQLDAVQAGLKMEFLDDHLRLNIDGYHYDYKNIQLTSFTSVTVSQIVNAAAAEMYGFEGDLEAKVTDHFSVTGNLSLEHAEFTKYPNAVFSIPLGGGALALVPGDATGNQTPFSQPVQASVGFNYTMNSDIGSWIFNLTNSYNSGFYFESDNVLKQPAYDYINVSTTWILPDEHYSIKLWGTNLLDEHVGAYAATQTLGKVISYNNPPRLVGITFEAQF